MYIYHEKLTVGTVEMWSSQKLVGVGQLRRSRAAAQEGFVASGVADTAGGGAYPPQRHVQHC
jgi:hypothetical protein